MSCEQYLVCLAFDIKKDCEIVMHGLHNSFSESWHLFILELAPVETENSLECSQQACPLHIPKHRADSNTVCCYTGTGGRIQCSLAPYPTPKHQPQFFSSFPTSHKHFSAICCLPPAPTALPSPDPEIQILAEQARQAEDSAEAASAINQSFLMG